MYFRSGDSLEVKLLEVGISEIRYRKWSNLQGPLYVCLKKEVGSIRYENGVLDKFPSAPPPIEVEKRSKRYSSGNPRGYYPFGIGLNILGPTGVFSTEANYLLKPSFEALLGLGIGGGYAGFRYHIFGGTEKRSTPYIGGFVNVDLSDIILVGQPSLYFPLGVEYLSKEGFYFAPEFAAYFRRIRLKSKPADIVPYLGIRGGMRFPK